MRQLWSSGWLHNRIRVVCASFLVKNLLLPWQWGLKHYWDALLDADLECAALGWQYVSGCLAGAVPLPASPSLATGGILLPYESFFRTQCWLRLQMSCCEQCEAGWGDEL